MTKRNYTQERIERDRILAVLEEERRHLVFAAREIAHILWDKTQAPVTAGQVFEAMHEVPGMEKILVKHDKRWLGSVFIRDWTRVGYVTTGSHCRPVSQWIPTEH